ncbi:hypothetical protein RJ641_034016 [Dillenia turbinata]|uniref:Uncharacterized protein n=1 Tax=Dillenia turbinata TaxID=194707 RepID=A0AAN8VWC3_9MAGN
MHDDINEGEEGYEVEDHDIEEIDKSDDSQFDVQNIRGLDDTFISDESLFPPTFNVKEKERPRLKEDIQSLLKLMSTRSTSTFSFSSQDGSGFWFYACDLFAKKEHLEIFFRQPNDELKLG